MHAVFMLYGKKAMVDEFIKWLETRIFYLKFENPNLIPSGPKDATGNLLKEGFQPIDGQLRYGLFGTYEFIFPETSKDEVLATLDFHKEPYQNTFWDKIKMKSRLLMLRKALALEPIPEFKTNKTMLLPENIKKFISIIPLGVRYDPVRALPDGLVHEAI